MNFYGWSDYLVDNFLKTKMDKWTLQITFSIAIFLFSSSNNLILGQNLPNDSLIVADVTQQKDVTDYYRMLFAKKSVAEHDSAKKKSIGPFYTPLPYPGYSLVTGGMIGAINSLSFYTHYGDGAKMSNISVENMYTQNKQLLNIVRSNIWLNHEKYNLLGDWRYYQYPNITYGLGSKTLLSDVSKVDYSLLRVYEVVMRQVNKNVCVGLGYSLDYHWNIAETNNPEIVNTDFDKYGYSNTSVSSGITLNFQFDNRLNSNNPAKGVYANLQIRDNLTVLKSDNNWQSATLDFRYYIPISKRTGNRIALWSYNVVILGGIPPYFDLPSTGWDTNDNTGRGYIEGRFRGRNALYFEAEYRFTITKNGFLGGVLFSNFSSFSEPISNKFEKINPSYGLGLRIKVNKFSNTNLCIDYGFGAGGSRGFAFGLNENF
jgi:outer membrane protein assembly factor BamA